MSASQKVDHPTPHMMRAVEAAGHPMLEELVRLENAWKLMMGFAGELDEIELSTRSVSVKAAVSAALHHQLEAITQLRRALCIVREAGR